MLSYTQLSNKSDVVKFIVFKRQIRRQLKRLLNCLYVAICIALIALCVYHRSSIIAFGDKVAQKITQIADYVFKTKIEKIAIHLQDNTILDDQEISNIVKQLSNKSVDRQQLLATINSIKEQNQIVDKVYARKNFVNGNVDIYVKEKNIIGIIIPDECENITYCNKKMISKENTIIDYHHIKDGGNLLKIYGDVNKHDINELYDLLKKYNIFDKVSFVKFYTSGRFDMTLTNGLVVKFPRNEWLKTIKRFNKLDSEYMFSTGYQNIKYLDLRIADKIFVGEKN